MYFLPVCGFQPDGNTLLSGGDGMIVNGRSLSTYFHSSGEDDTSYLA